MSHTMHVFGYSPHANSLNRMVLITGFGSGMVDFDVNFPELSDADVLVEPDMKQGVNVSASTRFVAPLSETDVKTIDRFTRKCLLRKTRPGRFRGDCVMACTQK